METKIITELVQFEALDTSTDEQIVDAVQRVNQFQKAYEGYLDAEIAKDMKEDSWSIIFHYENFEWVQAIGSDLRSSKEFMDFRSLMAPESLNVSFGRQFKNWQSYTHPYSIFISSFLDFLLTGYASGRLPAL